MKNGENNITIIALVISIFLVCIMLIISFYILFFPDSHLFFEPYSNPHDSEYSYYKLDFTQNESDFSYKIDIASRDGRKLPIKSSYLTLERLVDYKQSNSLTIADYENTKEFFKHIQYNSYHYDRIPAQINFSINVSISIKYIDSDNNEYLSEGDYFILSIFDLDRNKSYDLSQYYYNKYRFEILNEQDNTCARITLNERPPSPDDPIRMSESISNESPPLCLIIFITVFIVLFGFQLYFLLKIIKNRIDKT